MGNLTELGRRWGHSRPDHLAVRCGGRDLTWKQLEAGSDAIARGLRSSGVRAGDRVGVLLLNCVELPEVVLATLKLGAISVPLNVMLPAPELAPIIRDSACSVVIAEAALLKNIDADVRDELGIEVFTLEGADGTETLDSLRLDGATPEIVDVAEDAPAFICYTSGTTGVQKGAVLTHGSIRPAAIAKTLCEALTFHERVLIPVALVYTGAIISAYMQVGYYLGATTVLERNASPENLLEVIERERITVMTMVPIVYERMAASPEFSTRDISSLTSVNAGGAPVSLDLLRAYQAKGIPMLQSYGMTECSGLASILDFADAVSHLGFAGLPILGTRIAIVDPEGNHLPPNEVGEVCLRGPHVMAGYWRRPDLTAETIIDGWLHSGDLGLLDADGFLKIVDRKKDMLISGGLNVYPAEIEKALAGLASLGEFTIIGIPDHRWGEVPLLVFHSDADPSAVAAEVRGECQRSLAKYKWPKYVVDLDAPLPRTFSGKISKPTLRRQLETLPPSVVSLET